MKPRVFIGSSVESLNVARTIQEIFDYEFDVTVWDQDVFHLTSYALNDLLRSFENYDFGIFVFSPDDITSIRNKQFQTARDNVIFEFGLFLGKFEQNRCFIVMPSVNTDFHLPTDLVGIEIAKYDPARSDNLKAALGSACNKIRRTIHKIGPLPNKDGLSLYSRVKDEAHFVKLLERANREILAIGPTLLYVAQYLKEYVFKRAREGIDIKLLVMDNNKSAVSLIENYASPFDFPNELKLCHKTFKRWMSEAGSQLSLNIRKTVIIPVTLVIVDGQYDGGYMVLTPGPFHTSGAERPCFLIEKRAYPEAFSIYYSKSLEWWNQSVPLI